MPWTPPPGTCCVWVIPQTSSTTSVCGNRGSLPRSHPNHKEGSLRALPHLLGTGRALSVLTIVPRALLERTGQDRCLHVSRVRTVSRAAPQARSTGGHTKAQSHSLGQPSFLPREGFPEEGSQDFPPAQAGHRNLASCSETCPDSAVTPFPSQHSPFQAISLPPTSNPCTAFSVSTGFPQSLLLCSHSPALFLG